MSVIEGSSYKRSSNSTEDPERNVKVRRVAKNDPALLLSYQPKSGEPPSLTAFNQIVVLGDSYSSNTPVNWVGCLCKRFPKDLKPNVRNFAQPGDTAQDDLEVQLQRLFANVPSAESHEGNALVVIWIGINDCGRTDADELEPIVEQVLDVMHRLYIKWKARAFLLIDVPPMHRSPGGIDLGMEEERYTTWNEELLSQVKAFAESTSKASIFVVSSYTIISGLLDNPEAYGLLNSIDSWDDSEEESEAEESKGGDDSDRNGDAENGQDSGKKCSGLKPMWEDDIHLSPAGHKVFADRVWEILRG